MFQFILDILVGAFLSFIPAKKKSGRVLTIVISGIVLFLAVVAVIKNSSF
jgi:hypothetical protein